MPSLMRPGTVSALTIAIAGAGIPASFPALAQESPPQAQEQTLHLDEMLVQEAIQRGLAEIEMARLAEERAEADAVHSFAELMLEQHGKLNERLIQAAREIGAEIPSGPNESEASVIGRLKTLRGAAFDEVYAVGVAQDHMRHHNLYARLAGYASAPVLRRIGAEAVPVLEEHLAAAQALRVEVRPIAQGPLGAVPDQAAEPSEATPQRRQAPYSDEAEGAEP
ncbi:DUF4142 domain-containing protein (plasmid) [Skermanella rosea]|uniref:DUF4142 domain-containing protein n=1 Tax=Skermanella rosea TaxID=1817965 RepID=UPI001933FE92|nr:DUF4142 domain-containing protein [Skermanella rosea]UEM07888.1 DUF4142 domain-containing protein [Skermanella rosea]